MTTGFYRETAKLYQFPTPQRGTVDRQRDAATPSSLKSPVVVADVSGGAWYHEAAIQETQRAGESRTFWKR